MDFRTLVRTMAVFMIMVVTFSVDGSDNLLARLDLSGNYPLIMAAAVAFTMILARRHLYIVAAVAILSLIANMPADFSLNFGFDRDYYAGIMVALAIQPAVTRIMS